MRIEHSALTHGFGLTLVLLAIPLAVAAGTLAVPNTFTNGTVADADEVNANFDEIETEVNDNDSRITAAQSTADAATTDAADAQSTADSAVTDAAAAQSTADTAVTDAAAAQGTANTAVTDASAAQTTADAAQATLSTHGPHDRPGSANTALGADALINNTTGSANTANGYAALFHNTTGNANTASGRLALFSNTNGFTNTAIGDQALYSNSIGSENTASGRTALRANTSGNANTASGNMALYSNTVGEHNTAVGNYALRSNNGNSAQAKRNTAVGANALSGNTTGKENTAIGWEALKGNTEGDFNIAIGTKAGSATTGDRNILIGNIGQPSEGDTIRIGKFQDIAFIAGIQGNEVGDGQGRGGGDVVFVSDVDELGTTSTANHIRLGYADGSDPNAGLDSSGTIRIGTPGAHLKTYIEGDVILSKAIRQDHSHASYDVWIQGSQGSVSGDVRNLAVLGEKITDTLVLNYGGEYTNGTEIQSDLTVSGCITGNFCSDARLKVHIEPLGTSVLADVMQLEASTYQWKDDREQGTQIGLIAQEVEKVFPEVVSTGIDGLQKGLSCTGLNAVTIQAVKELKLQKDAEIAALQRSYAELQQQLALVERLSGRLAKLEAQVRADSQVVQASAGSAGG